MFDCSYAKSGISTCPIIQQNTLGFLQHADFYRFNCYNPVCACDWCGNLLYDGEGIHEPTGAKMTGPDGKTLPEQLNFCGGECKADYHRPTPVMVDVSGVDWGLLARQKRALLHQFLDEKRHLEDRDGGSVPTEPLIELISHIQEQAAQVLGEKVYCGKD